MDENKYKLSFQETFNIDEKKDLIGLKYQDIEEWDSLGHMSMIGALEEEFDIMFEMEDIIDYKLPFGFLGQLTHPLLVKKQLHKIFEFREKKLAELFGQVDGKENFLSIGKV